MSNDAADVPSLTLRVLEKIQLELVGLRGDVREVKGEIVDMKGDISEIKGELVDMNRELKQLNGRFDNSLGFVGRDVADLKVRVTAVEQHLGLPRTPKRRQ
jgi:hypothetical protein